MSGAPDDVVEDETAPDDVVGELVPIGAFLEGIQKWETDVAEDTAVRTLKLAGRSLPSALDAERAVLGAIILDGTTLKDAVDVGLAPEHFFRPAHQILFRTLLQVQEAGEPIGTHSVVDALQRAQQIDQVGGAAAIAQLEAMMPTTAHVGSYARILVDKAMQRRMIDVAQSIVADAFKGKHKVEQLVERTQTNLKQIKVPQRSAFAMQLARARADIEKNLSRGRWEGPIGRSALELVQTKAPPRKPVVQGLIDEGALVICAAPPKSGKTWLVADVVVSVASGTPVFDEFQVIRPGPVLWIALEDHERDLRSRLRSIVAGKKLEERVLANVFYESRFGIDLLNMDDLAGIVASARMLPTPPRLIVIDPLSDAHSVENENSNAEMKRVLRCARVLRDLIGCALLIVHHMAKNNDREQKGSSPFDRFRGASAIRGAYDCGIAYDVRSKSASSIKANIDVEVRAGQPPGPFGIELTIEDDEDKRAKHAEWKYWHDRSQMMGPDDGENLGDIDKVIGQLRLRWFEAEAKKQEPEPLSARAISIQLRINAKKVGLLLRELVDRKIAAYTERGGRKNSGYIYSNQGGGAQA